MKTIGNLQTSVRVIESRQVRDRFLVHANNPRLPQHARSLAATLATMAANESRLWLSTLRS